MVTVDLQQRIVICRQRLEAAPQSRAFAPLADSLRQAGRYVEALAVLADGLKRHPKFQAALVIQGHTLLDSDRSAEAQTVLRQVLQYDNDNVVALRLLTEDARSRQAWREAIPLLEKLCVLEPDDDRWPRVLAETRANRALPDPADVPDTSFATLTLVEIYLAQGYRAKAMAALRQMQAREPEREDIAAKIGEIGIMEGEVPSGVDGRQTTREAPGLDNEVGYAARRAKMAAKRAEEKKHFETWIERIRSDESPSP